MATEIEKVTTTVVTERNIPDAPAIVEVEVPVPAPEPVPDIPPVVDVIVVDEMDEEMSQEILDRLAAIEGRLPTAEAAEPETDPVVEDPEDDPATDPVVPNVDDPADPDADDDDDDSDKPGPGYNRPEIENTPNSKNKTERKPKQKLGWRGMLMAGSGGMVGNKR